jgi:hypothetical protein
VKTAFILCGALAREVMAIIRLHGWDVDLFGIPALIHMVPERITPEVEKRLESLKDRYDRLLVVYGDCGTVGVLDKLLDRYGIERVAGPHCYEMYSGDTFQKLMEEEPGTYFLTDFLLRGFEGLVIKGMGLHEFPSLKSVFFANYKRLVYLVQAEDPALLNKAEEVAEYLELPLEIHHTGYGLLEERLVDFMERTRQKPQASLEAQSAAESTGK